MLVCEDLVRDVLCRELIAAANAAKAGVAEDIPPHLENMGCILMSPKDFMHVDDMIDIRDIVRKIGETC